MTESALLAPELLVKQSRGEACADWDACCTWPALE